MLHYKNYMCKLFTYSINLYIFLKILREPKSHQWKKIIKRNNYYTYFIIHLALAYLWSYIVDGPFVTA